MFTKYITDSISLSYYLDASLTIAMPPYLTIFPKISQLTKYFLGGCRNGGIACCKDYSCYNLGRTYNAPHHDLVCFSATSEGIFLIRDMWSHQFKSPFLTCSNRGFQMLF